MARGEEAGFVQWPALSPKYRRALEKSREKDSVGITLGICDGAERVEKEGKYISSTNDNLMAG